MNFPRETRDLTLFCFPCAGASATSYLRWRRLVPSWLRIEPVEPPGRGLRMGETLLRESGAAIEDLTAKLLSQIRGRYALFGHSMGALLAFGCAHRLLKHGAPPPLALAVAATAAPTCRPPKAERRKSDVELIDDLRRLNGAPEALFRDAEMLRLTLDVLAADYEICNSFEAKEAHALSVSILVYGGMTDSVSEAQLSAWGLESNAPSTVTMFDGGHFFIREHENAFLRHLIRDLSRLSRQIYRN